MKQDYIAVADKSRIYPPGVAANGDGFDVCFISEAKLRAASLQKREQAACRQNPLPP